MCGRFSLFADLISLVRRYNSELADIDWKPRYNLAPAQEALTVVQEHGQRKIKPMFWGLIPSWSKDRSSGMKSINARAETIAEKPSFRKPFKSQRCLVPADGFFEWRHSEKKKIPMRIALKDESILSFAGLWDLWQPPEGQAIFSFTIITTEANELLKPLHDRMPAILSHEGEEIWLNDTISDQEKLMSVLKPYPSEGLKFFEVSPVVNSWKNDTPDCVKPIIP